MARSVFVKFITGDRTRTPGSRYLCSSPAFVCYLRRMRVARVCLCASFISPNANRMENKIEFYPFEMSRATTLHCARSGDGDASGLSCEATFVLRIRIRMRCVWLSECLKIRAQTASHDDILHTIWTCKHVHDKTFALARAREWVSDSASTRCRHVRIYSFSASNESAPHTHWVRSITHKHIIK